MVPFHAATNADSPLAHLVVSLSAIRACVFLSATDANAALALGQIVLCNVALQR